MTRSDHRARSGIPSHASDYGTPCRTLGSIRCTFGALLLLGLLLLLGRRLLLRLCLLLGWRCRRWCLR
jgi:hypothetical protein